MSAETVEQVAARVLASAKAAAKDAEIRVDVRRTGAANVRFAKNEVTTSGEYDELALSVWIGLGKRAAWASTNQSDPRSVAALVDRALAMARLSPEDPETMPLLSPQTYGTSAAYDDRLAAMTPAERAAIAGRAIAAGDAAKVQIAGFLQRRVTDHAIASSTGLAARHRETSATYTVTARTLDASGSGWAGREIHRATDLDDASLARVAIDKAARSASAKPIPPGKYTVILEPQAVAELLMFLPDAMNLRSVDEGRSYFTGKTSEKVFADFVRLESDPTSPLTPGSPFDAEGMALAPQTWIESGRAKDLFVSRFWAQQKGGGVKPTGHHTIHRLSGGSAASLDDIVKDTKRGLLVTRFWYNRMLEPQTVMVTGLTRDGLFLVEDGKITAPLTNFRYNESPITMLRNVDAMTKSTVRVPVWGGTWHVPALRTNEFTMASPSAAV
ncbi:MAG: TldD/PmbA family protein [Labilithrix sp.]|nr:TldD/PmbA family protein [Labilithrix sp.]